MLSGANAFGGESGTGPTPDDAKRRPARLVIVRVVI